MPKYDKVQRQLLLYEICFTSREVTMSELIRRLGVCKKTIRRDIADLTDAGLIQLEYNRKDDVYSSGEGSDVIVAKERTARHTYLQKLRRLAVFMEELSEAAMSSSEEFNCKERYHELFPGVSERTRFRDYRILSSIGYWILWDAFDKKHHTEGYLYSIREDF